jgi:hypothetical protein
MKHSTTAVEHVCKIAKDTFALIGLARLPNAFNVVDGHLNGLVKAIDGLQLIFPIDHFLVSQKFLESNIYENVFYACHFVVSSFDMHTLLSESNILDLGSFAAKIGRDYPALNPVINFTSGNFVSYTVIVMFAAHAKNSWDKMNSADAHQNEKDKAYYTFVYSIGTIAGVALGLTVLGGTPVATAVHLTTQIVGHLGWKTGAYTP